MADPQVTGQQKESTEAEDVFPLFNSFPLEIRRCIWTAHLPDVDPPALYRMSSRWFTKSNLITRFHETPPPAEITVDGEDITGLRFIEVVKLLRVNKESRDAVLTWANAHGYRFLHMSPLSLNSRIQIEQ
ncbi:hypothetical protein NLU13_1730 [Sarocladium strictum]|uniref:2EXR domain-containing protein n=1 Tax=Sarocladium strictum TaxID=5046 RepID=A0AA39GT33_SARSR|nr:hypothetical protein NLU13_1730 [Sarocladium strictum]